MNPAHPEPDNTKSSPEDDRSIPMFLRRGYVRPEAKEGVDNSAPLTPIKHPDLECEMADLHCDARIPMFLRRGYVSPDKEKTSNE